MEERPEPQKPAAKIIAAFGGINPMARELKLSPSTVQGWKERGYIPAKRQAEVLAAAQRLGKTVSKDDFFEDAA